MYTYWKIYADWEPGEEVLRIVCTRKVREKFVKILIKVEIVLKLFYEYKWTFQWNELAMVKLPWSWII